MHSPILGLLWTLDVCIYILLVGAIVPFFSAVPERISLASTTTRISDDSGMDVDGQVLSGGSFSCLFQDPSASYRRALIHHLVSGACFEHKLDAHPNSKIDRSTCAVIAEEFESTSSITAPVLDIILTAERKKISTEHLCHVAAALIIPSGSHYILTLRKGKRAEREQQTKAADLAQYTPKLEKIRESWPQLIPQSPKDKIIKLFREMTSSEAFTSFMYFNLEVLKRPDTAENEALLLDHYKWLHPDCIPPPMPA
ncbi:hypothetical protein B0H14DRAFT_2571243 [Mycena olivaceomarginata]|nr:hypothetical protein B0H14DRAFT_2571243 [Mycena olivaceomarginata]